MLSQRDVRLFVLTFTYHNGFFAFVNTQSFQFDIFFVLCFIFVHFYVQLANSLLCCAHGAPNLSEVAPAERPLCALGALDRAQCSPQGQHGLQTPELPSLLRLWHNLIAS
jgi:hypothetical protein